MIPSNPLASSTVEIVSSKFPEHMEDITQIVWLTKQMDTGCFMPCSELVEYAMKVKQKQVIQQESGCQRI